MKLSRQFCLLMVAVALVGVVGCGQKTPTPDQAIMEVMNGLSQNKPEAAWNFLPASYQTDVNGLVADFAGKMDAEIWAKGASVVQKLVNVLKTKKDFILSNQMVKANPAMAMAGPDAAKKLAENWDGILEFLNIVATSELADLEKMKTLDVGAFIAGTGGKLMNQAAALSAMVPDDPYNTKVKKLGETKVTVLSSDATTAKVKVEVPGEDAEETDMVLVEGKWLPKEIADEWQEKIAEAKKGIAEIKPEDMAKQKPQVMAMLTMVEGTLDQLAAAKTQQEFDATAQQAMGSIMGAAMMMGGGMGGGPAPAPQTGPAPAPKTAPAK